MEVLIDNLVLKQEKIQDSGAIMGYIRHKSEEPISLISKQKIRLIIYNLHCGGTQNVLDTIQIQRKKQSLLLSAPIQQST